MTDSTTNPDHPPLTCGVVVRVTEESCEIRTATTTASMRRA